MSDLISRQAVNEVLCDLGLGDEENGGDPEYMSALHDCKEFIDQIPSVENKGEWIPVSERFPEDDKDVLVYCGQYCGQGNVKIAYYHHDYTTYSIGFKDLNETGWYDENDDAMYHEPIAWQPLPEPYKAEKGGK